MRSSRATITGVDVTNRNAVFRTDVDGQKPVTEIRDRAVAGPAARIETRYMETLDRMVTELANTPGGQAFNRTVLRRKGT